MRTHAINRRRSHFDQQVVDAVRDLHLAGVRPPDIATHLDDTYPDARVPSLRTIQQWIHSWGKDQSGPWRLSLADVSDTEAALPVLAALVEETEGRVLALTHAEAEMLGRVVRITRDMPPVGAYRWARAYAAAEAEGGPTASFVHYLAFAPWRDNGARYVAAYERGYIPDLRTFCPGDREWLPAERRTSSSFSADAVGAPARRRQS